MKLLEKNTLQLGRDRPIADIPENAVQMKPEMPSGDGPSVSEITPVDPGDVGQDLETR
jgi:hypothetical protein